MNAITVRTPKKFIARCDAILKNVSEEVRSDINSNMIKVLETAFILGFKDCASKKLSHFKQINKNISTLTLATKESHTKKVGTHTALEPNAKFSLSFEYSYSDEELTVFWAEDNSNSFDYSTKYIPILIKELYSVKEYFENKYSKSNFFIHFFDAANSLGYCRADGQSAVNMMKIYKNALIHYPDFRNLNKESQINLLYSCVGRSDIYIMAKNTFYAFLRHNLIENYINESTLSEKIISYKLIKPHYDTVYNRTLKKRVPDLNTVLFVRYNTPHYETSFSAFDMWRVLVK